MVYLWLFYTEEYLSDVEVGKLIAYCLAGLEQCVLRFPEHYKSIYRLCHYYFNNRAAKDNAKCRDLLLGTYKCQNYAGQTFQGLFADRKSTNFFNVSILFVHVNFIFLFFFHDYNFFFYAKTSSNICSKA